MTAQTNTTPSSSTVKAQRDQLISLSAKISADMAVARRSAASADSRRDIDYYNRRIIELTNRQKDVEWQLARLTSAEAFDIHEIAVAEQPVEGVVIDILTRKPMTKAQIHRYHMHLLELQLRKRDRYDSHFTTRDRSGSVSAMTAALHAYEARRIHESMIDDRARNEAVLDSKAFKRVLRMKITFCTDDAETAFGAWKNMLMECACWEDALYNAQEKRQEEVTKLIRFRQRWADAYARARMDNIAGSWDAFTATLPEWEQRDREQIEVNGRRYAYQMAKYEAMLTAAEEVYAELMDQLHSQGMLQKVSTYYQRGRGRRTRHLSDDRKAEINLYLAQQKMDAARWYEDAIAVLPDDFFETRDAQ